MPAHDWTRVSAATYHDFHCSWITHLKEEMNANVLPADYFAMSEQQAGDVVPDVLTFQSEEDGPVGPAGIDPGPIETATAVAEAPPKVSIVDQGTTDAAFYARRQRSLVIRHAEHSRIVAILELISPGNKHSRTSIEQVVDKATAAVEHGIHLLFVDLFPPGRFDPRGMHGLIWEELGEPPFEPPAGKPLTLASYCVSYATTAYVEPFAVGSPLIDMPLFLTPEHYVNVPLQSTYDEAYRGMPAHVRRQLEA